MGFFYKNSVIIQGVGCGSRIYSKTYFADAHLSCPSSPELHHIIIGSGGFKDGEETIFSLRCAEDIT